MPYHRAYTSSYDSSKTDGCGPRGAPGHRSHSRLHGASSDERERNGLLPLDALQSGESQPRLLQEDGSSSDRLFSGTRARQRA